MQLYEESLKDADGNSPGPATDVFWQFSTPAGLQSILAYVSRRYQRPEVWLTENGMAVPGEANMTREAALQDVKRLEFFRYRGVERHHRPCMQRGAACMRSRALKSAFRRVDWSHTHLRGQLKEGLGHGWF